MMGPVSIKSAGILCSVGLDARSSWAAIRCGISGCTETGWREQLEEPVMGCPIPIELPLDLSQRLPLMADHAIRDCMEPDMPRDRIALILCLAGDDRPSPAWDQREAIYGQVMQLAGPFHPLSYLITRGNVSGAYAILGASELLHSGQVEACLIVGVDSLLNRASLNAIFQTNRLLTDRHLDGMIPGEAAAAVLLGEADESHRVSCTGLGFGHEPAPILSGLPLRSDGLAQAMEEAVLEAGVSIWDLDYRLNDVNGEHYAFKDAKLATMRVFHEPKGRFNMSHPAECVGEIGAAFGPLILGVGFHEGLRKGHLSLLCHLSNDGGERASFVLRATGSAP